MSTGNNLHNSLKRAFDDFEAPLKDSQWMGLEGELNSINKRKKWRFFPYYFSGILLVAIISGILSYYFVFENNNSNSEKNYSSSKKYKFDSEQNSPKDGLAKQQIDENKNLSETFKSSDNLNSNSNTQTSITINKNRTLPLFKNKNRKKLPIENIEEKRNSNDISENKNIKENNISSTETIDTTNQNDVVTIADKTQNDEKIEEEKPVETKNKQQDSVVTAKPDNSKKKNKSKYVISLATGYSNLNVKVTSVEDINKVHKDTRKIFEMSNKNTKTLFINFGFDCNVFKGFNIGLNTGFQYLHITQPVNIEYRMMEIPFYDIDRQIIGYIHKDSATADVFKTTNTNKTSFIKIPLRFNYTLPLNLKNELLITAGTNISTIISAKGNVISINDGQVKPLSKQMFGKLNFGFLGGLQYSRQLKNQWWMGIENQWQINPEIYKNGPEKIKNRLSGYNINLILKYKI